LLALRARITFTTWQFSTWTLGVTVAVLKAA
jgi:hypothetical protein